MCWFQLSYAFYAFYEFYALGFIFRNRGPELTLGVACPGFHLLRLHDGQVVIAENKTTMHRTHRMHAFYA
jgi:hypothetical protein